MKLNYNIKNYNIFFKIYYVYIIFMGMNFFLTPNPFSALHSGRAGHGSDFFSDSFFIIPAYIVLTSICIVQILEYKFTYSRRVLIACFFMILSGVITGVIFTETITYLYNIIIIIGVSSLALLHYTNLEKYNSDYVKISKHLTIFMIIGVILALVFPNRYGWLPFEFSRESRGEVTLWNVMGIFSIFPAISIIIFNKYKKINAIIVSLIM